MTNRYPVLFGEVLFDCFEEDGSRVLGGAPFNVAWHLQGFGLKPVFISRVGDDSPGRGILSVMQRWQMSETGMQRDLVHPTGEVNISLRDGQPTFDIVADSAYDYIDTASIPALNPSLIYHGSLGLRSKVSARALADLVTRYHAPVFLDVNLRSPWWGIKQVLKLLDHTRWLKINDDELNVLVDGQGSAMEKASTLRQRHSIELVIVTEGAKGAMSLDSEGRTHRVVPERTTEIVDTVGAGDAFASVCILGLNNNWSMSKTLRRAQSFASLVVAQRGATIEDAGVYERLITEWQSLT